MPTVPTSSHERALWKSGIRFIAGLDEAGCGAWAGPVYAGAVILAPNTRIPLLRDSKLLSPAQRESVAQTIKVRSVAWAFGSASVEEISTLNIRKAAFLAMRRAVSNLSIAPEWILCDAFSPMKEIPCTPIIKGDAHVRSIAAASIIAKVARDAHMNDLAQAFPQYGFENHKGYGTAQHQKALKIHGPCEIHRPTYAPIQNHNRQLERM